jgi:hypothetical protein
MGASLIIIGRIRSKHSVQVPFPKNQDVIQAFAPEGPDQALNIWVLPRRSWRDRVVPDSHRSNSTGKGRPVGAIIVAYQIGWCRLPRECLYNLLRQPFCRRVPGHREPEQLSSTVAKDEKRKQALERQSWDQAKINRRNGVGMIAQKMSASSAMAVRCAGSCTWRPSTRRSQTRASAIHHGCAGRPIVDFPCSSVGSVPATPGQPRVFPIEREISSANRPETLRDASAESCRAEPRGTI